MTQIYPINDQYLPTFIPFTNIYPVNIPYMEHLGIDLGCLPARRDLSTETGDRRVTITV